MIRDAVLKEIKQRREPYPYQRAVFTELHESALDFVQSQGMTLPLRPRWHRLLVGSTGAGKTELVRLLAERLDWSLLPLSASNWILLGCTSDRGAGMTWSVIAEWLLRLGSGDYGIINIDEIDKIDGENTWCRHLRTEIFDLLDGRVPVGLTVCDDSTDEPRKRDARQLGLEARLRRRVLIVGSGAFQDIWEGRQARPVGFGEAPSSELREEITLNDLSKYLPRELVNRFHSSVLSLPVPGEEDYRQMIAAIGQSLAPPLRQTFLRIARRRMQSILQDRRGARCCEEILVMALRARRRGRGRSDLSSSLVE